MASTLAPSSSLPAPRALQRHHQQAIAASRWLQRHPRQAPAVCQTPLLRARLQRAAASEDRDGRGVEQQPAIQHQEQQQQPGEPQQATAVAAAAEAPTLAASSTAGRRLKLLATLLVVTTSAVANRVLYKVRMVGSMMQAQGQAPRAVPSSVPFWQPKHLDAGAPCPNPPDQCTIPSFL